ncbi:MAG: response regulator [Planctomycetota bacterium]
MLSDEIRAGQKTVLIIEDEEMIILSTQMLLESVGYRVEAAQNGEEGIRKAAEIDPDLILLDVMMPGLDGWETLGLLKRRPETEGIPVVVFTAREHAHGQNKSRELGATAYFRKPFEPDDLIELVARSIRS